MLQQFELPSAKGHPQKTFLWQFDGQMIRLIDVL